jgi:hypothetical protein
MLTKKLITCFFLLIFYSVSFGLGDTQLEDDLEPTTSKTNSNFPTANISVDNDASTFAEFAINHNVKDFLRILPEYQYSDSLFYEDIPDELKTYLMIEFVDTDDITINKSIIIRGYNKFKGGVFINDQALVCDQNGYFSHEFTFNEFGEHAIYVSFTTLENKFITVRKTINYLFEPEYPIPDVALKKSVIYFYNSDILHNIKEKKLDDGVTRADLAYLLYSISDHNDGLSDMRALVNDVSLNEWYNSSVWFVLNNQLMGEFLDGRFYPDRKITRLELLVTLVRFMGIVDSGKPHLLSYSDFVQNHWSSKFVSAALNFGLISPSSELNPNDDVSFLEFLNIIRRMPSVITLFSKPSENIGLSNDVDEADTAVISYLAPVLDYLENNQTNIGFQLEINSHTSNQVVYTENITLKGSVFPSLPFYIGEDVVTPNMLGEFSYDFVLDNGLNKITISRDDLSNTFKVLFLNGYEDLQGHWLKDLAAKLNYLELLVATDVFDPKLSITRYEFIQNSYPFFYPLIQSSSKDKGLDDFFLNTTSSNSGLVSQTNVQNGTEEGFELLQATQTTDVGDENNSVLSDESVSLNEIVISDIEYDALDVDYLNFLIKHGVLSLYEGNKLFPDRSMTRMEAIAAIVKFLSLFDQNYQTATMTSNFPFWDVSKSHWGRSFLEIAYNNDMITKNNNFYPDKELTKDQLIALLSKTPFAKQQLASLNSYD